MKYSKSNPPLVCMMTQSTCYQGTRVITPKGVLWHSTGANNPYLKRYVQPDDNAQNKDELLKLLGKNTYGNDWNHVKRMAGLNCWVGKLADGTVTTVQTMPWNYKPWGCGSGSKGSLNDTHLQFECCEDSLDDKDYFNAVYKEACEITAYLCQMYNIDPHGTFKFNGVIVPTIVCHWDSYLLKLGGGHSDVYPWFNKYNKTMDNVRDDVAALLAGATTISTPVSSEVAVNYQGKVTASDGLNCRSAASMSGKVVKTYKQGTILTITKESGGWGYTGEGWVYLSYIEKVDDTQKKEDEVDMSKEEVVALIEQTVSKAVYSAVAEAVGKALPVYQTMDDVPTWYKDSVQKLIDAGALQGTGEGNLNVSEITCRDMTLLDRLGKLD